jgi:hypothetical protein
MDDPTATSKGRSGWRHVANLRHDIGSTLSDYSSITIDQSTMTLYRIQQNRNRYQHGPQRSILLSCQLPLSLFTNPTKRTSTAMTFYDQQEEEALRMVTPLELEWLTIDYSIDENGTTPHRYDLPLHIYRSTLLCLSSSSFATSMDAEATNTKRANRYLMSMVRQAESSFSHMMTCIPRLSSNFSSSTSSSSLESPPSLASTIVSMSSSINSSMRWSVQRLYKPPRVVLTKEESMAAAKEELKRKRFSGHHDDRHIRTKFTPPIDDEKDGIRPKIIAIWDHYNDDNSGSGSSPLTSRVYCWYPKKLYHLNGAYFIPDLVRTDDLRMDRCDGMWQTIKSPPPLKIGSVDYPLIWSHACTIPLIGILLLTCNNVDDDDDISRERVSVYDPVSDSYRMLEWSIPLKCWSPSGVTITYMNGHIILFGYERISCDAMFDGSKRIGMSTGTSSINDTTLLVINCYILNLESLLDTSKTGTRQLPHRIPLSQWTCLLNALPKTYSTSSSFVVSM